jgi:hypothetical protein
MNSRLGLPSDLGEDFVEAANLSDLILDLPHGIVIGVHEICLLRTDDFEVVAFDDRTPGRGQPISLAACVRGLKRGARYGLDLAIPASDPDAPPAGLNFHQVRIIDDVVEVRM